jgi:hypothetical protein
MRMWRVKGDPVALAGEGDVINVASMAGEKALVLNPPNRLPDPELGHFRPFP